MTDDPDMAPSPEETLRLIEEQRAVTVRRLRGDPLVRYAPWGVAWLIGFGCFFLHYGLSGEPYAPISQGQALAVMMVANVLAGAVTAYELARTNAGVRGGNSAKGMMYGYTWVAAFILLGVLAGRLSFVLPEQEAGLLWAAASLLIVGILYMAGGAIWLYWPMFFMGVAILTVDGIGVVLGPGWHALLAAVLLGGGQIVAGLVLRRRV